MKTLRLAATLAASLCLAAAVPAHAQNNPLASGEYVQITEVTIDDGHNLDYAAFLAGQWRAQEEFALKQGWTTGFEILGNVNKRAGEPDLYLVRRMKGIPDAAEQAHREEVIRGQMRMSDAQMEAGSGDRAKYRHVGGTMLLQKLNFK